jgi:long-subunit acyl-CoA synthetase (AMP-forming)
MPTRPPKLLLEWAYERERTTPDEIWLTQPLGGGKVRDYTWRAALDEARRMAAYLKSLPLSSGSPIALLSKNCAHWILADLAIWMAGHVSVPLYPTLGAETVRQILEHSEARLLFVGKLDGWDAMKDGVPASLQTIALPISPLEGGAQWAELIASREPLPGEIARGADELATLVYTSGSTGTPKGAMLTFGAMSAFPPSVLQVLPLRSSDRFLAHLTLAHVAERAYIECTGLAAGYRIYFAESVQTFLDDLKRARPTLFLSVPRVYQKFQLGVFSKIPAHKLERLLKIPIVSRLVRRKVLSGLGLDHVRLAGVGAAPVPSDLLMWYRRLGLELIEGYGMTENFGLSHLTRPGQVRPGYAGSPMPGVEQRISTEGEVQMKTPAMMKGYYKAPELTAQAITEDGWLCTGDRGEIDEMGRLRITGRVKELFKTSKAKYVAPAPIESKLSSHPLVEAVCVTGAGRPQPFALVMLGTDGMKQATGPGRSEVEAALAEHLRAVNATLDPHEMPDFLVVVRDEWTTDNGFLTPTLKIKRAAIEDAYTPEIDGWYALKKPVIWQELTRRATEPQ